MPIKTKGSETGMSEFRELYVRLKEAGHASDFPVILGNTLHRVLLDAYKGVTSSWPTWCKIEKSIKDFKENTRFRITEVEDLQPVPWGQPARETSFDETSPVKYIVMNWERAFGIPWQLLRNDDVGAIKQIPQALGRAAGRTVAKFAASLLASRTPSTTVTSALSETSLAAAIAEFKKRTDPKSGSPLGVVPKYLVVPPDLEVTAKRILNSQVLIAIGMDNTAKVQGDYNVMNARETGLTLVVEPFLPDSNDWYLVADPNDTPGIELGFLDGKTEPQVLTKRSNIQEFDSVFERGSFETGSIDYKVVYDFGGALIDPNAILKVSVS